MKQVFAYTSPAEVVGDRCTKFFTVSRLGKNYQVSVRSGIGLVTSVIVPAKIMSGLAAVLTEGEKRERSN